MKQQNLATGSPKQKSNAKRLPSSCFSEIARLAEQIGYRPIFGNTISKRGILYRDRLSKMLDCKIGFGYWDCKCSYGSDWWDGTWAVATISGESYQWKRNDNWNGEVPLSFCTRWWEFVLHIYISVLYLYYWEKTWATASQWNKSRTEPQLRQYGYCPFAITYFMLNREQLQRILGIKNKRRLIKKLQASNEYFWYL